MSEDTSRRRAAVPFWRSLSTEELIRQQNVAPADDLDAIGALWPADDHPDALLNHVIAEREGRAKVKAGR